MGIQVSPRVMRRLAITKRSAYVNQNKICVLHCENVQDIYVPPVKQHGINPQKSLANITINHHLLLGFLASWLVAQSVLPALISRPALN